MMDLFQRQAERFGTEIRFEMVQEVDFQARPFKLKTDMGEYLARTVIISTGASARLLGLPSEKELMGFGVSACATCDGAFFKEKKVLVVGGGDTAMEEANYLTRFAKEVVVVHRREEFRASKIMLERAKANPKISWLLNAAIEEVLSLPDKKRVRGVAVFKGQIDMDETGYIQVGKGTLTNVEGVFACGDVMDKTYRQAVTAAGTGCMAAIDAERWLESQGR
jgi:thioredoxin reductase (NADPH)